MQLNNCSNIYIKGTDEFFWCSTDSTEIFSAKFNSLPDYETHELKLKSDVYNIIFLNNKMMIFTDYSSNLFSVKIG